MKEVHCERVLIAAMAQSDGEESELSPEEVGSHLGTCEACRDEVVRMQSVTEKFFKASPAESGVDLWPGVSTRLAASHQKVSWRPFVVVGVLLLACKLFEMVPETDPGWVVKLVPLIIFAALLFFLRENPFKINSELNVEKSL